MADNDLSSLDNRFEQLWLGLVFVDISSPHALDSMQPEAGPGIKLFVLRFCFQRWPIHIHLLHKIQWNYSISAQL